MSGFSGFVMFSRAGRARCRRNWLLATLSLGLVSTELLFSDEVPRMKEHRGGPARVRP